MQQWGFLCSERQWTWHATNGDCTVRESPLWFTSYVSMLSNAMSAGYDRNYVLNTFTKPLHLNETACVPLLDRACADCSATSLGLGGRVSVAHRNCGALGV